MGGSKLDETLREMIRHAHRRGVEVMVENRMAGLVLNSSVPKFYPLNPIKEFDQYEAAFRRASRWGADYIDFSYNDLEGISRYPEVVARYGHEDTWSGRFMADMMMRVRTLVERERPGMPLYVLPRFYGGVHWDRHPATFSDFWSNGPPGMIMMVTSPRDPRVGEARRRWGGHVLSWINYTSNHVPENRAILTCPLNLDYLFDVPRAERRALISTGMPPLVQKPVLLAAGEIFWNYRASDTARSLAKAARRMMNAEAAAAYAAYGRLLPRQVVESSTGQEAAALASLPPSELRRKIVLWEAFERKAHAATQLARQMKAAASCGQTRQMADVLFWSGAADGNRLSHRRPARPQPVVQQC